MKAKLFLVVAVLAVAVGAAQAENPVNPVLSNLLKKGIATPDGSSIQLPAPTLADDMDAAAQAAALTKLAAPKYRLDQFLQKASSAPIATNFKKISSGDALVRSVNLGFVAHGRWNVLNSESFART